MSLPSNSAVAKPTARAARNQAQTLVELIGADSGQYPTQQEIDERLGRPCHPRRRPDPSSHGHLEPRLDQCS